MNILINPDHHLRSGWRFGAFVAVFLLLWVALGAALSAFLSRSSADYGQTAMLLLNAVALFIPAVGATLFMARIVDRTPLSAFGIVLHRGWVRDYAEGLALSAAMLVGLTALAITVGGAAIRATTPRSSATLFGTALLLVIAAASEELVFRGYPLQVLMKGIGPWPAAAAMSLLFGLLHLSNPDASPFSTANTVLAGLLLSIAYFRTRSLWFPYGIHLGWNLGLGVTLGYPVSGIHLASIWTTVVNGSTRLFGGSYGPEGGLAGTVIFGAAAISLRLLCSPRVSPEIRRAVSSHSDKIYASEIK